MIDVYNGMKVGDIITTYNKGYYELVEITLRGDTAPLFSYIIRFDIKGNVKTSKTIKTCDSSYCRPATDSIKQIKNDIKRLKELVHNLGD